MHSATGFTRAGAIRERQRAAGREGVERDPRVPTEDEIGNRMPYGGNASASWYGTGARFGLLSDGGRITGVVLERAGHGRVVPGSPPETGDSEPLRLISRSLVRSKST